MDILANFDTNFNKIFQDTIEDAELEAAQNLVLMSRGTCQRIPTPIIKNEHRSSPIIHNEFVKIEVKSPKNYELKLSEKIQALPTNAVEIYNQLIEKSNVERQIYIAHELCENPISMNYNPNKSNSIRRHSTADNNEPNENRSRNNVASRVSRFKRKREFHLAKLTTEFMEAANETLEKELIEMAMIIRQKESVLAKKLNSDELAQRLRERSGLDDCLT